MVRLIMGGKGSGKTKRILDLANDAAKKQHGDVIFVDDDNRYMFDLRHEVRFVNAGEYGMRSADMFYGFLCGMLAQNFDMKVVFIDAFLKLTKTPIDEMGWFFERLDEYSKAHGIDFILSISVDEADMPEFVKPYFIK